VSEVEYGKLASSQSEASTMFSLHPEILSKGGKPQFAVLPYEEYAQLTQELARAAERVASDPRYGTVFDNLSAEELARRQGIAPAMEAASLYGEGDPADWEGFDEVIEEWRGRKETA
jgi:hypothetical protein